MRVKSLLEKFIRRKKFPPEGLDFFKLISRHEDACEARTASILPRLGKLAPLCFENLGTVLSLLDRAASCFWGCRRGDHVVEYLVGRVCTSSYAARRLFQFGYYDESLSITRSIGEISNLLWLFNLDASTFEKWRRAPDSERRHRFSPVRVRFRLEEICREKSPDLKLLMIQQDRYGALSALATHVTPETRPQAHNPLRRPLAGSVFQEAGAVVALQELAGATGRAALALPKLLGYDERRTGEFRDAGAHLISSIGRLSVLNIDECFAEMRESRKRSDT